jgi:hypothetical protein
LSYTAWQDGTTVVWTDVHQYRRHFHKTHSIEIQIYRDTTEDRTEILSERNGVVRAQSQRREQGNCDKEGDREEGSKSHMCHRWQWIIVGVQRRAIDGLVQSYVT